MRTSSDGIIKNLFDKHKFNLRVSKKCEELLLACTVTISYLQINKNERVLFRFGRGYNWIKNLCSHKYVFLRCTLNWLLMNSTSKQIRELYFSHYKYSAEVMLVVGSFVKKKFINDSSMKRILWHFHEICGKK